jgi:hypothetical protein
VLVALPLSVLGVQEGASLTSIQAFTALADDATGAPLTFDQANLADANIPAKQVSFGIAPKGTPLGNVLFDHTATLTDGHFLGTADLPAGPYDVWARACLGATCSPSVSWLPIQLLGVVSRKLHGNAGTYDVNLSLTGNPSIECRSGSANGSYTVVFRFAKALTSVGGAGVTSGAGSVSSSNIDSNDARNYAVNLTGVTNAQTIAVSLSNVTDSAGNSSAAISASMAVLVGDTTGNGAVNSSDIAQTQSQSGQPVTSDNFREDVTVNGLINSSDIAVVQSRSGTALP